MLVKTLTASLLAALLLIVPGCDDGAGSTDLDASDAISTDTGDSGDTLGADATDTASPADTASTGDYACGATLTCGLGTACASRGQGACIGDPPDDDGHCAPNCAVYECGGGPTCLCDSYWCVDLPSNCDSCGCATAPDSSCMCDDSSGHVVFSCLGA
ncbi:MAG: hypothetical protein CVU56_20175 [Deltaproteobacteria bacterium HGW-Deltaproteobacteria-14]|jgi:hypothetical protein|nr:MAG: hypothetical protein CVU56_20175 [Deltaproteobacteria bacterium HGW-Deltaproteobacteria-14]